MGIPDEPFWASAELVTSYRAHCAARGQDHITDWHHASTQQQRDDFERTYSLQPADGWKLLLPQFDADSKLATRQAFQKILEASIESIPTILSGAADLTGNTGTKIGGASAFSASQPEGKQVYYGIREHAMGSALVGMAMHGGVLPVAGTFSCLLITCALPSDWPRYRKQKASLFLVMIQWASAKMDQLINPSNILRPCVLSLGYKSSGRPIKTKHARLGWQRSNTMDPLRLS